MSARITSLPLGSTLGGTIPIVQNPDTTSKVELPDVAVRGAATNSEVRAGVETDKIVTPAGLHARLNDLERDTLHAWDDWSALAVLSSNTDGATLINNMGVHDGASKLNFSTFGNTTYPDIALVYSNGFPTGTALPPDPSPSDTWISSLIVRQTNFWWLMVRWQLAGVKLYSSQKIDPLVWSEVNIYSETLVQNSRGLVAGDGWFAVAAGASNLPAYGSNADFANIPWFMRRATDKVYAVSLGYQDTGYTYRGGSATRDFIGSSPHVVSGTLTTVSDNLRLTLVMSDGTSVVVNET